MQGLGIFRSRFFWRLYASYSALLIAIAVLIGFLVHLRLSKSLVETLTSTLQDACSLLAPYAEDCFRDGLAVQGTLERLGRETGLRITLIDPDGGVRGDSAHDASLMENHGRRAEVVEARAQEFGIALRPSRTERREMLYVAKVLREEGGELGTIRVSVPLDDVHLQLRAVRSPVLLVLVLGLGVALVLGLFIARSTTLPIAQMKRLAEDIRAGRPPGRVPFQPNDEIGLLADTLHRLGREITEKITAFSREDARLRAMLAGMVEGVVAVGGDDRIGFCNAAARRLLRVELDEIEGMKVWEVVRVPGVEELLREARTRGKAVRRELTVVHVPHEQILEAHAGTFQDGDQSGLVIVFHDITDLRRLERVRRDFVANVSHELKTPLTSIKGFVETLLDGAVHDQKNNVRFLERIDHNVERLSHLVSDLLSLARVEAQSDSVVRVAVDWRDVMESVVRRHRHALEEKGLSLEADVDSVVVLGDTEAMTEVLDNLLDNAIQYTPAPGTVRVRLHRGDRKGILEVEDTGVGIPDHDRERIFERFYRVDRARSRELGGTGLGLSIVKNLVLALGGEVRVESELGRGTRFVVELPLAA